MRDTQRDFDRRLDNLEGKKESTEYPPVTIATALSEKWLCADVERELYRNPRTGELHHLPLRETIDEEEGVITIVADIEEGALDVVDADSNGVVLESMVGSDR